MCTEAASSLPCVHEGRRLEQGLPTAFWKLIRRRGAQESKKGDTWRLDMESGLDPSSGPGISRVLVTSVLSSVPSFSLYIHISSSGCHLGVPSAPALGLSQPHPGTSENQWL